MGDNSKIEWTDATWNPITGCTKVSQGCKNCYAETLANRMWATQYPPNPDGSPRKFTDIRLHEDRLDQPLRWTRPRMIFVNSMSDLFHEAVPDEFIRAVFTVMERAHRHVFQVLTKRAKRMFEFMQDWSAMPDATDKYVPASNVWLGVSVEDQDSADTRIPYLLRTPAAVRFLSCEPLLGPVVLTPYLADEIWERDSDGTIVGQEFRPRNDLHWVIVGGESGPKARPMHPDWARTIRDECIWAGIPFFFKQWGQWSPKLNGLTEYGKGELLKRGSGRVARGYYALPDGTLMRRTGKYNSGRELDGENWDNFPATKVMA